MFIKFIIILMLLNSVKSRINISFNNKIIQNRNKIFKKIFKGLNKTFIEHFNVLNKNKTEIFNQNNYYYPLEYIVSVI